MLDITNNLYQIRNEIKQIALSEGRLSNEVRLIAVSKTQALNNIALAYAAGQRDFAENYIQEAIDKIRKIKNTPSLYIPEYKQDICWHYIGQIQSNKCQHIAQYFDWVHSVSRLKHAQRLNRLRSNHLPPLNICLQVSFEQKQGRAGLHIDEIQELITQLSHLKQIKVRGLMCVLPNGWRGDKAYTAFKQLKTLCDEIKIQSPEFDCLSMGMSSDYPEAIRAGATMLRLGTAIFGARQ